MSLDIISELEFKIDYLIETVNSLRQENQHLREELGRRDQQGHEFEQQRNAFNEQLELLKGDTEERQRRIDDAAGKIQALIAKLESVQ